MHHRYENKNIPIELVRTLVAISESGSYTRAAALLGLSQPAITAQVKRLQGIVGGTLFEKGPGGVEMSALGRLVVSHARTIIDANDRLMSMAGVGGDARSWRIGISSQFVDSFVRSFARLNKRPAIQVFCSASDEVARSLADGVIDIACLLQPDELSDPVVPDWDVRLVWASAPGLTIHPGQAVPLVLWPSKLIDRVVIRALDGAGLMYALVLSSPDFYARLAAVRAGIGFAPLLVENIVAPIEIARDKLLPPLPPVRAGIRVRAGLDPSEIQPVVEALRVAIAGEGDVNGRERKL
jgi:DNA-binding transcriptional LysR family regulator